MRELEPIGPKLETREPRQTQARLSSEQTDLLVTAYLQGATVYELAEEFGIHRVTASKILKRRGVVLRLQSLASEQVVSAVALYEGGLSLKRVGEQLGCDAGTVRSALAKAGIEIRKRNGWPRN